MEDNGQRVCACEKCDKTFATKQSLKRHHENIHLGIKYSCIVCFIKFTRKEYLDVHQFIHTGVNLFGCQSCGAKFTTMGSLKRHEVVHTRIKAFKCHCGLYFSQAANLTRHVKRVHLNERKYVCDTVGCLKTFKSKQDLENHARIHSGEKHFICNHCNMRFTQSAGLCNHLKTHSNETPYACRFCFKMFKQCRYLKKHLYKIHKDELANCHFGGANSNSKESVSGAPQTHKESESNKYVSCINKKLNSINVNEIQKVKELVRPCSVYLYRMLVK